MTEDRTFSRLARVPDGRRMVAGVCAGLSQHTGIDPVIFRVAFALLAMAGGLGINLYIAAVLLMPANPERLSVAEKTFRRRFDGEAVLAILGALLGLGVLIGMAGDETSRGSLIAVTVFGLALLVAHARDVNLAHVAMGFPKQLRGHALRPNAPPGTGESTPPPASGGAHAGGPQEGGPPADGMVDLAALGTDYPAPPVPSAPPPPRTPRPRSVLTPVTMLLAMMAGTAVFPAVLGRSANSIAQITMAAALAVVGLGLVVASVLGRGRGLVAFGALLSLGLLATSVLALVPPGGRFGDVAWRPTDTRSAQTYRMTAGVGALDLTALPLRPGQRIRVNAEIAVGELRVTVPRDSRVEAHLTARVGDVTVDSRVVGGPNATLDGVLEPEEQEGEPVRNPPTIELFVRGKLGNVEVTRA